MIENPKKEGGLERLKRAWWRLVSLGGLSFLIFGDFLGDSAIAQTWKRLQQNKPPSSSEQVVGPHNLPRDWVEAGKEDYEGKRDLLELIASLNDPTEIENFLLKGTYYLPPLDPNNRTTIKVSEEGYFYSFKGEKLKKLIEDLVHRLLGNFQISEVDPKVTLQVKPTYEVTDVSVAIFKNDQEGANQLSIFLRKFGIQTFNYKFQRDYYVVLTLKIVNKENGRVLRLISFGLPSTGQYFSQEYAEFYFNSLRLLGVRDLRIDDPLTAIVLSIIDAFQNLNDYLDEILNKQTSLQVPIIFIVPEEIAT